MTVLYTFANVYVINLSLPGKTKNRNLSLIRPSVRSFYTAGHNLLYLMLETCINIHLGMTVSCYSKSHSEILPNFSENCQIVAKYIFKKIQLFPIVKKLLRENSNKIQIFCEKIFFT